MTQEKKLEEFEIKEETVSIKKEFFSGSPVDDTCTVYVQGAGSTVKDTCTVYVQEEIIKRERTDDQGKIYSLITSAQNQNTQNIIYQFRGHISPC